MAPVLFLVLSQWSNSFHRTYFISSITDLHGSAVIWVSFSTLPPSSIWKDELQSASSAGNNLLTFYFSIHSSLSYLSLSKEHTQTLSFSLSWQCLEQSLPARFSVVFPDECSFVSCVSLYTPSYQSPRVVSPPRPLTHHTVQPSIQHGGWLFFFSLQVPFSLKDAALRFRLHFPQQI